MNEYLLLIRSKGDAVTRMPKGEQAEHIEKVFEFLEELEAEGHLRDAQPVKPQGALVMKKEGKLSHIPIDPNREIVSGFYHIMAEDLDAAIKIAKRDPRFENGAWKIEVRPLEIRLEGE